MLDSATILAVVEALALMYILVRRSRKRRTSILLLRQELARSQEREKTASASIEAMLEENAQLRHKLLVEQLKFHFIEQENNELRQVLFVHNNTDK